MRPALQVEERETRLVLLGQWHSLTTNRHRLNTAKNRLYPRRYLWVWAQVQHPRHSPLSDHLKVGGHDRLVSLLGLDRPFQLDRDKIQRALERETADAIVAAMRHPVLDLVGKDTLKQLPALLERGQLLMTPDSGPMHIANAMGTKVLGLHAASNPARSGPYSDRRYCADRYDDAARKYLGRGAAEIAWGRKIEHDGVMDLVTVEDGIAAFERYRADHPGR